MRETQRSITPSYDSWQREIWGLYKALGEFRSVVDWKANMISRVRLRAAIKEPGIDEPVVQDSGPPVDYINQLVSVQGTQSEIMGDLATQLSVPGECWLLGEDDVWRVCSSEEIRGKSNGYEVISEESTAQSVRWRSVMPNHIVTRVWKPDRELRYLPDSAARAAMSTMRELELVSRHMQAQYLSRLASAGILLIPDEVALPARPEFADAPDPFVREWIETAAEAIRYPGTASSVVPVPMRVPSEYIEHFRHVDFTLALDDKIVEKRESIINRLALQLDAPPEILLGTSDTNHWGAWKLEEDALKAYILPSVELICSALTIGYLRPMLQASGYSDDATWVVWYDASEIIIRPDKSTLAEKAYDRLELSGEALRRESGFDEQDAPTKDELEQQILKILARQPQNGFTALDEILGRAIVRAAQESSTKPQEPDDTTPAADDERSTPDTMEDARNANGDKQYARLQRMVKQATLPHYVSINAFGNDVLIHPDACKEHLFSCPFTSAAHYSDIIVKPGTTATYRVMLDSTGKLCYGSPTTEVLLGHNTQMT
jgi:hypothetical protein